MSKSQKSSTEDVCSAQAAWEESTACTCSWPSETGELLSVQCHSWLQLTKIKLITGQKMVSLSNSKTKNLIYGFIKNFMCPILKLLNNPLFLPHHLQSCLNSDTLLYLARLNVLQIGGLFEYSCKFFPNPKQMHYHATRQDLRRNTTAASWDLLTKQQSTSFAASPQELHAYVRVPPALPVGFTAAHQNQQLQHYWVLIYQPP